MANREEKKQMTEQHLYDVAIDLFCEQGYKQTTLTDIAAEADVSTRTLYKYFPTKESILRKFSKENIYSLKSFASNLPTNMPAKEKVLETMVYDFKAMFCLFDVSYILHSARDEHGMFARFELENILATESIYCNLLKQEQLNRGIEPNDMVVLCASVIMGMYRHCNDLYRFRKKGRLDEKDLRAFYSSHIDVIWDSLYEKLTTPQDGSSPIANIDKHLFGSVDGVRG
ncbi:TetR/AcrR family transcriptional regulator [Raoultibacter massiliensis]|uniref:TetR/AcrR family transcriptional regulator n=1 Tax=Raoultibacter massiliensis TaxID=1852371 RepID=A0ABV1JE17_9ACTN